MYFWLVLYQISVTRVILYSTLFLKNDLRNINDNLRKKKQIFDTYLKLFHCRIRSRVKRGN